MNGFKKKMATNQVKVAFFLIVFKLLHFQCVDCQSCKIEGLQGQFLQNKDKLKLNSKQGVIKEIPVEYVENIEATTVNMTYKYIDARLKENNKILEILVNKQFENYAFYEEKSSIYLDIMLSCNTGALKIIFVQPIDDTNIYVPEFSSPKYEIRAPLPLRPGYDLADLADISAVDYDISFNRISFSSDDSGIIEVGTGQSSEENKKTYYPTLRLNQWLSYIKEPIVFTIKATDNGNPAFSSTAQVTVTADESASLPAPPVFMKALYVGSLDTNKMLHLEDIILEEETYSSDVEFALSGEDSEYFIIRSQDNVLTIALKRDLSDDDIKSKQSLLCVVTATKPQASEGRTAFVITVPQKASVPKFAKGSYIGKFISTGRLLFTESIEILNETYSDDIKFALIGGDSEYFTYKNQRNKVEILNSSALPDSILESRNFLQFHLTAKRSSGEDAVTAIIITINDNDKCPFTPVFAKPTYHGTLSNDRTGVAIEFLMLNAETYSRDVKYYIEGPDAALFVVAHVSYTEVELDVDHVLTDDEIDGRTQLEFVVVAINGANRKGSTTVLIEVQLDEPPAPDPNEFPVFKKPFYYFEVLPGFSGRFGNVKAEITNANSTVYYSVEGNNEQLNQNLLIMEQTGDLILRKTLNLGEYSFGVVATNHKTEDKAYANAILLVRSPCSWKSNSSVDNTLLIESILEESEHHQIMSAHHEECTYDIINMQPNDREYVLLDKNTYTFSVISVDREDAIFSNMLVPQIQVHLQLLCPDDDEQDFVSRKRRSISNKMYFRSNVLSFEEADQEQSFVLTKNIPFNPRFTMLTLLIEDKNDHNPEFIIPNKNSTILGYPEAIVANEILLENLIRTHAVDQDSGINAIIKYSLNENDHFQIDSNTGVIYPKHNALETISHLDLIVCATDRNGSSEGLKTEVVLHAKKVLSNQLALITVNIKKLEAIEEVIESISKETRLDMHYLRAGVVSAETENYSFLVKLWVFALENDELVESGEIEKRINEVDDESIVSAKAYGQHEEKMEESNAGFIAAVCTLSVIIAILLGGGFAAWWIFIRPYDYKRMFFEKNEETTSTTDSTDHELKYKNAGPLHLGVSDYEIQKQHSVNDHLPTPLYQQRHSTKFPPVPGLTFDVTANDEPIATEDDVRPNGNENFLERRKSMVTFNENVERIDIERINDRSDHEDNEKL